MSVPEEPAPVKLITSLFSPGEELIHEAISTMTDLFGPVDWMSPPLFFDRTRYYAREMGWPLHRRFITFQELIPPTDLISVKLETNKIEGEYLDGENRLLNVDPGYISAERLILATGKNYIHRVYLGRGIFADLTLIFKKGTFIPLEWTYRDYSDPEMIETLNQIRETYMNELREKGLLRKKHN
jgi:hypothetical protein